MIRALTILALLATPAAAAEPDKVYRCDGKSTMTYRDGPGEMVIKRPGEMAIAIPHAGAAGRFSWWSPYEDSWACDRAPCAIYWQPQKGPAQIEYMLDEGKIVKCAPK